MRCRTALVRDYTTDDPGMAIASPVDHATTQIPPVGSTYPKSTKNRPLTENTAQKNPALNQCGTFHKNDLY